MDLETIWKEFIEKLLLNEAIISVLYKKIAGTPFLYISVKDWQMEKEVIENVIKNAAADVIKDRQLHSKTAFVRQQSGILVYRHRFYVPQRKMFCCGNLCPDCIRFESEWKKG
ncbi:hypothetical protein [Peribacillus kribbensis]|uniref:hypothetical protein n=1 Tax=Peribacillus kribbensis TaxID=356658 RepID=UPI0003FB44D6|nr:hypothetical protein [Peribacillus kribbensis]